MHGILLVAAFVFAAGGAAASVPAQSTHPETDLTTPGFKLSGSVFLQERPLPGTVLYYPGIFTPLRGPHGGLLAARQVKVHRA